MVTNKKKMGQAGYALPMVLLISMIIIVIGLAISFAVRQKINTAFELKAHSRARLLVHSAVNEVMYNVSLATFSADSLYIHRQDGTIVVWNLWNDPIVLDSGVTIKLQDGAGLVPTAFKVKMLRKLFLITSNDSAASNVFADSLADWQDSNNFKRLNGAESYDYQLAGHDYTPRNFTIQLPDELSLVMGNASLYPQLKEDVTYWGSSAINYLTMSERLLKALLPDKVWVEEIIKLRQSRELTYNTFHDITGIKRTEQVFFAPSGWIRVQIRAEVENAVDTLETVVVKSLRSKQPFMITEWKH